MPWRYVSRSELLEQLEGAELSPAGVNDLRRWLREMLVDADLEVDEAAASLIHASVERLDVAGANDTTLKEFAGQLRRLLCAVPDDNVARDLIPLIEQRERAAELLEKIGDGRISRTAFLSYIAERDWPITVKNSIAGLSSAALQELHHALTSRRYETLPALLSLS